MVGRKRFRRDRDERSGGIACAGEWGARCSARKHIRRWRNVARRSETGATRTFGPQKGATSEQLEILERALTRLADTVTRELGCDFRNKPGAGAAGGLGFGLMSFRGAELRLGFDVVADAVELEEKIK